MSDSVAKHDEMLELFGNPAPHPVKKNVKWVHTTARFGKPNPGDPAGEMIDEVGDYVFRLDHLSAFNRSEDDIHTTIDLITGYRTTITMKYEDFCKLIEDVN